MPPSPECIYKYGDESNSMYMDYDYVKFPFLFFQKTEQGFLREVFVIICDTAYTTLKEKYK